MDITNVSSALSALQFSDTSSLTQSVSMKMLDNALDMNATMSDGITRMMENSVYPNLGGNIDISVLKSVFVSKVLQTTKKCAYLHTFLLRIFLFNRDCFNLKHNILRKSCYFYTASGWKWCREKLSIHFIDCTEVVHFFNKYGCLNNFIHACSRCL